MNSKVLLISFSGGRTSAFMTKYILENSKYDVYDKHIVFMNTGKERIQTYKFINDCDKYWNFNTVWIEPVIYSEGKNSYKVVSYETADREGKAFEDMIKRYGISNISFPHCTRELKLRPLNKYMNSKGFKDYITAIGIRADEPHRLKPKLNIIYPLAEDMAMTSDLIRKFWDRQTFDLQLKDYEGNCDLCWKKSKRKKLTLIKENPEMADWWVEMESKYSKGKYYFHRNNESTQDLIEQSKGNFIPFHDAWDKKKFQVEMDFEMECFCKQT
jgi:hypothetical protein